MQYATMIKVAALGVIAAAATEVLSAFDSAAAELQQISQSGDREAFRRMFADVGAFFGSFSPRALEQSDFLIDRVVERA